MLRNIFSPILVTLHGIVTAANTEGIEPIKNIVEPITVRPEMKLTSLKIVQPRKAPFPIIIN